MIKEVVLKEFNGGEDLGDIAKIIYVEAITHKVVRVFMLWKYSIKVGKKKDFNT